MGARASRPQARGTRAVPRPLTYAKAKLDECAVVAPVTGTVEILATPGQFVSKFAPATLAKLTPEAK